jgi:hypothetical protein
VKYGDRRATAVVQREPATSARVGGIVVGLGLGADRRLRVRLGALLGVVSSCVVSVRSVVVLVARRWLAIVLRCGHQVVLPG